LWQILKSTSLQNSAGVATRVEQRRGIGGKRELIGPNDGGLVLKEEKVEQEVPGGPQATSFEELNPEQGKPRCITYMVLLIDGDRLHGSTLPYITLL
jgi:hypothetical protein